MNNETKKQLIKYLNGLARGKKPESCEAGICNLVYSKFGTEGTSITYRPMISWKKRAGYLFPIEGSYRGFEKRGKWAGKRGKLRRSLCRHIAKQLKAEL